MGPFLFMGGLLVIGTILSMLFPWGIWALLAAFAIDLIIIIYGIVRGTENEIKDK